MSARQAASDVQRRCGVYVRISKDDEGKEGAGLGVQRQEGDCREKAAQLGWEVVDVYPDNDTSAHSGKRRKHYERMLADIRSGRINAVVCWHTDRLHRRLADLSLYIKVVADSEVPTETCRSGELNLATATGRMLARTLGNIAEYEVDHLIERVSAAKQQHREQGRMSGSAAPFGYVRPGTLDPAELKRRRAAGLPDMIIVEAEAEALREAYRRVIEGGPDNTLVRIAAWLNDSGFRPSAATRKNGAEKWTMQQVRRTLMRASRAGLIEHDGVIVGQGKWEPIVDRATWETAKAILADPKRRTSPGPKPVWLLSGSLLTCGVCDGQLFRAKKGAQKNRFGYTCVRQCVRRDAQRTDDQVSAAVVERLSRPDAAALLRPGIDVAKLSAQRAALRIRLNAFASTPGIDPEQLGIVSRPLHEEIAKIDAQLTTSESGSALDGIAGQPDAEDIWFSYSLDRQRAIIRALVKVTILPARSQPHAIGVSWFDDQSVQIEFR